MVISGDGREQGPLLVVGPEPVADPWTRRPARPVRWAAAAAETRSVASRFIPVAGSNRNRRLKPASITTRTPRW